MDKYIKNVASKLEAINIDSTFHEDTILSLMVLIRQHLEANNLKNKYNMTAFYCDWCLHSALDRSPIVKEFLRQMSAAISDEDNASLNDRINEIISIHRLRIELEEISRLAGVKSILFTSYDGWKIFLRILLKLLIDKPIKSRENLGPGRYVTEFRLEILDFSKVDKAYLDQNSIMQGSVFWNVMVAPREYSLKGPLVVTESPNDF